MAVEEPTYRLIESDGSFELREYPPQVVVETRVEGGFESAGSVAFGRLFRYISGNNVAQQKIAMTAPVTQSGDAPRGEKIAMTAPVSQVADGKAFRIAFVLPAGYSVETAPKPLDPAVRVSKVPARVVAVWRYSGRWTEANYADNERQLRASMKQRGLDGIGEPILARYNPPFTPWFMRRNEVQIPVQPGTAR